MGKNRHIWPTTFHILFFICVTAKKRTAAQSPGMSLLWRTHQSYRWSYFIRASVCPVNSSHLRVWLWGIFLSLHGPLPGSGHDMPPQRGQVTLLSGWGQSFSSGTTNWGFLLQLLHLPLPALPPQFLPLLSLSKVVRIHRLLRRMPVI